MIYEEIDALNWSTLKHLATSPRMLKWRSEHPRPDSPALALGRGGHCALLEPERFAQTYAVPPKKWDRRFKDQKAEAAAWEATLAPGIEVLDFEEYETVVRLAEAVRAHPAAARLLRAGRVEEIVTWTDEETGVACKARLDFIAPMYLLDLKSTRQQKIRAMWHDFASYLHHGQVAWYHDGAIAARVIPPDAERPRVIFVQTVEPFDVVPAQMTPTDLQTGRALYRSLLRRYIECQAAGWFPGLAADVIDSALPPWAASGDQETEADW